jgi:hypothetical protein
LLGLAKGTPRGNHADSLLIFVILHWIVRSPSKG